MKLNPDCIRDILTEVESHADSFHAFRYDVENNQSSKLYAYTRNEILYHVRQCKASDLIDSYEEFGGGEIIYISDLTPTGHEFLASIQDPGIWSQIKEKANSLGTVSLPALLQIAANLFESFIRNRLGIS